ncbi:hypothetical protein ACSBR2_033832 [Camellia fascicularis]
MMPIYNNLEGKEKQANFASTSANSSASLESETTSVFNRSQSKCEEFLYPSVNCFATHDSCCVMTKAEMVNLQDEATQSGTSMTQEELSRQVFGEKKRYLHGFGIGPRPSSFISNTMSRACACDHEMETLRSEIETLREEWQRDHDELMKEREEGRKSRDVTQAQINHLHTMVTHLLQGRGGHSSVWYGIDESKLLLGDEV